MKASNADFAVTKFRPPQAWRSLVVRKRLLSRPDAANERKLLLICAPAGFGKSTVLAQAYNQLNDAGAAVAWMSVESRDREPRRFMLGLVRALQSIAPELARRLPGLIELCPDSGFDDLVDLVINDIVDFAHDITVFLDDFHDADGRVVGQILQRLLNYGPRNLHVCIASRNYPSFNLASLRVRDEVTEFDALTLRFNYEETREFFQDIRGHDLSECEISTVHERSEGWVAALQLIALSLDGARCAGDAIATFTGGNREMTDYLTADIFNRLDEDLRYFLLETSVLDKLSAPLCDHIRDCKNSALMLERAAKANLFLISLDRNNEWFRYHNLFRSFLRNQLARQRPDAVTDLYKRASLWFADRDLYEEAISYARKSKDVIATAGLVERFAVEHVRHGHISRLISEIHTLPQTVLAYRPWLSLYLAYALFHLRRIEQVELVIAAAEAAMKNGRSDGTSYSDAEYQEFDVKARAIRLCVAGSAGTGNGVINNVKAVLNYRPEIELTYRCTLLNLLGYLQMASGLHEESAATLHEACAFNQQKGVIYGVVYAYCFMGMGEAVRGRITRALEYYMHAETVAEEESGPHSLGYDLARLLRGIALYEQDRLDEARPLIESSAAIAGSSGPIEISVMAQNALAQFAFLDGDLEMALELLERAKHATCAPLYKAARLTVEAEKVLLLLRAGRLYAALSAAQEAGMDQHAGDGELPTQWDDLLCIPAITRCRLAVATGDPKNALPVLHSLRNLAREAGRARIELDLAILEIKALAACRNRIEAQELLFIALQQAYPENLSRAFIDELDLIAPLLECLIGTNPEVAAWLPPKLRQLTLKATEGDPSPDKRRDMNEQTTGSMYHLLEPLSEREQEVVAHLAAGKSNREIASDMNISLNTVKWHVQNIFSKLGVSNRTAATLAAQRLNLALGL